MSDKSPKVYLLPNLMTAGNLYCGFMAILTTFEVMQDPALGPNYYFRAIGFILGACLFDLLDGRLARIKGQESAFGREFDSIADVVSFGVAPAMLMMDMVLSEFGAEISRLVAFIYLLCGALRLARFNVIAADKAAKSDSSMEFTGFPIPAAAGVISSVTLFLLWMNEGEKELGYWKYALPILMLGLSALMFSEFEYPSFKMLNWRTRRSMPWVFCAIIVLVLTIQFWQVMPAVIFTGYLVYGLVRPWLSKKRRLEIEVGDEEDLPEELRILDEEEDVA